MLAVETCGLARAVEDHPTKVISTFSEQISRNPISQSVITVIVSRLFCLEAHVKHYFTLSSVSPQAESGKVLVVKTEVGDKQSLYVGLFSLKTNGFEVKYLRLLRKLCYSFLSTYPVW